MIRPSAPNRCRQSRSRRAASLPIIGMGTAVVYEIEISDPKFATLVESVRAFLNGGGKLIDTAPTYGRAEPNLGEILKRTGLRDKAFVATKISLRGNNQEKEGLAQVAQSMKDLGTNHFEVLQVHNIRDWKTQLNEHPAAEGRGEGEICRHHDVLREHLCGIRADPENREA